MKPDEEDGLRHVGEIVAKLPWWETLVERVIRTPPRLSTDRMKGDVSEALQANPLVDSHGDRR